MLNDLIRKTNILGRDLSARRSAVKGFPSGADTAELEKQYRDAKAETLRFVADNNVPRDTVVIIEDRILRELRVREDEKMLLDKQEQAAAVVAKAHKELDWLQRSVDSGFGNSQARYIQAKAKMDDFRAEYERMSASERSASCDVFARLDKEYLDAKAEFNRVGVTDRASLLNDLAAAKINLQKAQADYAECEKQAEALPLSEPITPVESGSGEICRALDGVATSEMPTEDAPDELFVADILEDEETESAAAPEVPKSREVLTLDDAQLTAQISEAVGLMLRDNERFKYILEEVRFQASMEVAKVRAEVEKIKRDAFLEAQKLTEELRQLKDDAAFIRQEAAQARIAMNTVNRARATATLNAQRTVNAARKTVAAARKAIDAAKSATVRKPF